MGRSTHVQLWWVIGALLAAGATVLYLGAGGWPGTRHQGVALLEGYCEASRPGLIAQPANTWSCLGWAVTGLWIAWDAARRRPPCDPFYPGLYAVIVALLAPAGMLFHASLTDWGGKLDVASMYFLVNFWVLYNLTRSFRWSRRTFVASYLLTTPLLLVPRVVYSEVGVGLAIFAALIAAALLTEALLAWPRSLARYVDLAAEERDRRWIWIGLGSYGLAHLAQWTLPCDPRSVLQPHAALHLIEIATLLALYALLFVGPHRPDGQSAAARKE